MNLADKIQFLYDNAKQHRNHRSVWIERPFLFFFKRKYWCLWISDEGNYWTVWRGDGETSSYTRAIAIDVRKEDGTRRTSGLSFGGEPHITGCWVTALSPWPARGKKVELVWNQMNNLINEAFDQVNSRKSSKK